MNKNQLTPTPKDALKIALERHPDFVGNVCITSYHATKSGLNKKDIAYRVLNANQVIQMSLTAVEKVNAHYDLFIDIRNAQLQQGEVGIAFAPELVTA